MSYVNQVVSDGNQLLKTRNLFIEYLRYTEPLSYAEWIDLPDSDKAAALYVQFYEQITLAWYHVSKTYKDEEEAVETIMQYLEKNVPVLVLSPKRFTPNYIYRVAYNCLFCICYDRKCVKDRLSHEISNVQYDSSGCSYDVFDYHPSDVDIHSELVKDDIWKVIEDLASSDPRVLDVVDMLINDKSCVTTGYCLSDHYKVADKLRREKDRLSGLRYSYAQKGDTKQVEAIKAKLNRIPKYSAKQQFKLDRPVLEYEQDGRVIQEENNLNVRRKVEDKAFSEILDKLRIELRVYFDGE